MEKEDIILEKLDGIKNDQKELKNDFKDMKNELNKRIDHVEEDLTNIKENHLHSIYVKLAEIKRDNKWIQIILIALMALLLKQIFLP